MLHRIFVTALAVISAPVVGFAFDLLTDLEAIRPTSAPGGLLYCLAKGHTVFRVESPSDPHQQAVEVLVSPAPVETIKRRDMVLIDGAIPTSGEKAPDHG